MWLNVAATAGATGFAPRPSRRAARVETSCSSSGRGGECFNFSRKIRTFACPPRSTSSRTCQCFANTRCTPCTRCNLCTRCTCTSFVMELVREAFLLVRFSSYNNELRWLRRAGEGVVGDANRPQEPRHRDWQRDWFPSYAILAVAFLLHVFFVFIWPFHCIHIGRPFHICCLRRRFSFR